jgi:hypothetical protein
MPGRRPPTTGPGTTRRKIVAVKEREHIETRRAADVTVREPTVEPMPRISWWWLPVIVLVLLTTLIVAAVIDAAFEGEEVFAQEMIPEYETDTPAVLPVAGAVAPFWVGSDAALDPDMPPWYQSEYHEDSAAVLVTGPLTGSWVGDDAALDPDMPAWYQPEYHHDTPWVRYTGVPRPAFWLGQDAGLD